MSFEHTAKRAASPLATCDRPRCARVAFLARAVFVCVVACLVFLVALPAPAMAKSYEMTRAVILGEASTNGDFMVTEARTFDFDGSYHSVYWTIPLSNASDITIIALGEVDSAGKMLREYEYSSSEAEGTYSVSRSSSALTVRAHFAKEDVAVTFAIQYVVSGAVKAWADTGDVTWQAVGPDWGVATQDVSVHLRLPVPQGESIELGDNVRVWVDGPLDGVTSFDEAAQTIVMKCPRVQSGQYLSAMCSFPVEWLTQMTPSSTPRLDHMMEMGAEVARSANEAREKAQRDVENSQIYSAGLAGLGSIVGVGVLLAKFRKVGKEYKAVFNDKYWRDVPSDDHPAVIGRLWRWGADKPEDITATLMRLTDMGAIKLDRVLRSDKSLLGNKMVEDYRLSRVPSVAESLTDKVDQAAMSLVFDTARVGRGCLSKKQLDKLNDREVVNEQGSPLDVLKKDAFLFSDFGTYAKADAERYRNRYDNWKTAVDKAVAQRGFFEAEGEYWRTRGRVIGFGLLLAAVGTLCIQGWMTYSIVTIWPAILAVVAAVVCFWLSSKMPRRSAEANEIAAKTEALRNWLKDFTNLKEAIPADVVLWDKLLVLSVVLGVSGRVIEQLKTAAPEILEDGALSGVYYWCMPWGNDSASDAFGQSVSAAQSMSAAELAATTASDIGGSVGGFGGGGFGDSFGGGSFGGGGGGAD